MNFYVHIIAEKSFLFWFVLAVSYVVGGGGVC